MLTSILIKYNNNRYCLELNTIEKSLLIGDNICDCFRELDKNTNMNMIDD